MTNAVNLASAAGTGFAFRNRIINGDMRIDQRNNGGALTAVSGGGYYFATDRFITYNLTGVSFTTQRVAEAPAGFTFSNKLTFPNAISLSTTGECTFQQAVEGFNVADFGWGTASAQTVTVSFWVRASYTGTFSVGFANSAGTRVYATTYAINSANTWEYKTVTIPGDTSGTWLTDNTVGLYLRFMLLSGSNFAVASNNTWATRAGSYNSSDSIYGARAVGAATSVSAGATWQVTGVQLEVGSVATPFERRPYGQELALCQRYYEGPILIKGQPGPANQSISAGTTTVVPKRTSGITITFNDTVGNVSRIYTQASGANQTMSSAPSFYSLDTSRLQHDFSTGAAIGFWWVGYFYISAEL